MKLNRPQPPRWRVECPRRPHLLRGWVVRSPRGVAVFCTPRHDAALEIAHSMAAVDALLTRVDHIERNTIGLQPMGESVNSFTGHTTPIFAVPDRPTW